jgi:hypothetical protein
MIPRARWTFPLQAQVMELWRESRAPQEMSLMVIWRVQRERHLAMLFISYELSAPADIGRSTALWQFYLFRIEECLGAKYHRQQHLLHQ